MREMWTSDAGGRKTGFTLIELLIVVGIIAVLAAIAVPNFLEAMTRSKVSRAKADLRSEATALEAYCVDSNAYPTMHEPGYTHSLTGVGDMMWWYTPNVLSTPVAYISNANLLCPFGGDFYQRANFPGQIWRRYSYENIVELEQAYLNGAPALVAKFGPLQNARNRIGRWRILCIGPDTNLLGMPGNSAWNPMVPYDPSNGSVSWGNIMRTQASPIGANSEPLVFP
jgi:prepilin-type N-terminal cleavage/methylation domain-containing protein